ncbi:MAG: carboxypeptidase regulatory-like domain-containing protein [Planctomycetes bacterium]|nr:carboxypeptidase regulatory-like domain-containing protein [Planctomycetota bacterium]
MNDKSLLTRRLTVTFTRDGSPAPGIDSWLASEPAFGRESPTLHDEAMAFPTSAVHVESLPDGVARFECVYLGRHYLGFDLTADHAHPNWFVMNPLYPGHDYAVRLGSARILGRVFDSAGRPSPGISIAVEPAVPDPQTKLLINVYARTNDHGEFEIGALAAGDYAVVLERDGRFDGFGDVERRSVTLAAGETRRVQFGDEGLGARWHGRVLNEFSNPFEGTGRLQLERRDGVGARTTTIAVDGGFTLPVTAGEWNILVHVTGAPEAGHDLGRIVLDGLDVERDLIVPGARVAGRVTGLAPDLLADPSGAPVLSFHREGEDFPAAFRSVSLHRDGTYAIDAVGPGRWVASLWPVAFDGDSVTVDVLEGVRIVQRDFNVRGK